jgi:GTP 3',8-cyclase
MGTAAGPGRINYLRLSVTDRCNLRCRYCTYWRDWEKLPAGEILSYEEMLRLAAVAGEVGLAKVRITGGEPLMRRSLVDFVGKLHQVPGITKVCLTTNGVLLPELAPALYEGGSAAPQCQPRHPAPGTLPAAHRRGSLAGGAQRARTGDVPGLCPSQNQLRGPAGRQ